MEKIKIKNLPNVESAQLKIINMTDITREYICSHIFEPTQINNKELVLTCRECNVKITAEIVSVQTV